METKRYGDLDQIVKDLDQLVKEYIDQDETVTLPLLTIGGTGYVTFKRTEFLNKRLLAVNSKLELCKQQNLKEDINEYLFLNEQLSSAKIEGANTSIQRLKELIANPEKKRNKSDKMVLDIIEGTKQPMYGYATNKWMIETWKVATANSLENKSAGANGFRADMVYLGNSERIVHVPEKPEFIEERMQSLMDYVNNEKDKLLAAIVAHFYFEYIHPFCDGNGRMGRLLAHRVLFMNDEFGIGVNIPVISTLCGNTPSYYKYLLVSEHKDEKGNIDITPFINFMISMYTVATARYLISAQELSPKEAKLLQKMNKPHKGIISVEKAAQIMGSSNHKALLTLLDLEERGFLKMEGEEFHLYWRKLET